MTIRVGLHAEDFDELAYPDFRLATESEVDVREDLQSFHRFEHGVRTAHRGCDARIDPFDRLGIFLDRSYVGRKQRKSDQVIVGILTNPAFKLIGIDTVPDTIQNFHLVPRLHQRRREITQTDVGNHNHIEFLKRPGIDEQYFHSYPFTFCLYVGWSWM